MPVDDAAVSEKQELPPQTTITQMLWAVKENVTKGTGNTTFSPDDSCTRAQIVTFLWRTMA